MRHTMTEIRKPAVSLMFVVMFCMSTPHAGEVFNPFLHNKMVTSTESTQNGSASQDHISQNSAPATGIKLFQNYENPFHPKTILSYALPSKQLVAVTVHNVLGVELKKLVYEIQGMGRHTVTFDASGLPSGAYFFRISTDKGFIQIRKMVTIK